MQKFIVAIAASIALIGAAVAEPVTLRANIVTQGPAITLGDVFAHAGDAGARAVALSPAPGRSQAYSPLFFAAAASAAGLDWAPPQGMSQIIVTRAAAPTRAQATAASVTRTGAQAPPAVRRGETIALVYVAPGLQLTARARAMEDGAVGDTIRALNLQSNRQVDAAITGPGAASAALN